MISILIPDLRGGGVERIRLVLAHEFARLGLTVEFVLMQAQGELLAETQASFPIVDLATPRSRNLLFALARYLRQRRPAALLAAMWPLTTIAPLSCKLSGHRCRILVSEHSMLSMQYRNWGQAHFGAMRMSMALGYRLAHARVGVSAGVVDDIASLSGISNQAFNVIHNPVPLRPEVDEATMIEVERLWAGPRGARIVTVGNLKAEKNHKLLLHSFAQLNRQDAQLIIVGEGVEREALQRLAWELGIIDRVVFAGFYADPTPFYRTADLFVLSSDYEGFGNVIIEALSCGTPVVSTDCPSGPAEILEGGRYGPLTPVGDTSALAQAIEAALDEPVERDALIRRAGDFAPDISARRYLDLLGLM